MSEGKMEHARKHFVEHRSQLISVHLLGHKGAEKLPSCNFADLKSVIRDCMDAAIREQEKLEEENVRERFVDRFFIKATISAYFFAWQSLETWDRSAPAEKAPGIPPASFPITSPAPFLST